jgi:hypothetical protein
MQRMGGWLLLLLGSAANAANFNVTSIAPTGAGSLSQAILDANNLAGADTINFQIAGTGIKILTIPNSGLATITEAVTINGYSQTGAQVNTTASGATNAVLTIEINGNGLNINDEVFDLNAPATIRGVAIRSFGSLSSAIRVNASAAGSSVRGCFIGTNAAGVASGANSTGITLSGQAQIGSTTVADRNLIADAASGIAIFGGGSNSVIEGNLFGTNAAGTLAQGNSRAIRTGNATVNAVRIGGTAAGAGNVIANSADNGVELFEPISATPGSGNSILGNSFFGNAGLAIDLGGDELPDPIDSGDADSGINGRENAPALSFARVNATTIQIFGTLDGNFTNGIKRVEYFASSTAHASGFGEGRIFLGSSNINPTGIQIAVIRTTQTPASMPPMPFFVTATSTNFDGSTSEFSNAVAAVDGGTLRTVTNINDSGAGSLRQAIIDTAAAGIDTIAFNIAGNGPHTISPASALPTLSGSVIIDGYTETFSSENQLAVGSDADLRIIIDGSNAGPNNALQISSGTLIVRGLVIQHAGNAGITITGGSNHRIEGVFIGTDGSTDLGNIGSGVAVGAGATGVRIGGSLIAQRNLISGNNGIGINMAGNNSSVIGNIIGTGANGTSAIPNTFGAISFSGSGGLIAGNRIRNNSSRAISINTASAQVAIRANDVFSNGGPGIDLNADGITFNDINDVDSGSNGLQNFPVLTRVEQTQLSGVRVEGNLDRPAGAGSFSFELDLFASTACDGTHGEGESFILSQTLNFANGSAETFAFDVPGIVLANNTVTTATVTDALGNTSEFSACFNSSLQPNAVFANGFE